MKIFVFISLCLLTLTLQAQNRSSRELPRFDTVDVTLFDIGRMSREDERIVKKIKSERRYKKMPLTTALGYITNDGRKFYVPVTSKAIGKLKSIAESMGVKYRIVLKSFPGYFRSNGKKFFIVDNIIRQLK